VIPWPRLVRLIEPHYPKAGQGRQCQRQLKVDPPLLGSPK
jgi:hypothetical protein